MAYKQVPVWDRFVRFFHWGLVACFAIAYFSTVGAPAWVHNWAGYATVALVAARIAWGFTGTKHARFFDFVAGPRHVWRYLRAMLHRREPRYIGHNPAAALMILFLLAMVTGIGVTGWTLTLDAFWGNDKVEDVHVLLVDISLATVAIHVSAAVYESWNHREDLIWSMVVGTKRETSEDQDRPAIDEPVADDPHHGNPSLATKRGSSVAGTGIPK